jgi:hypothetical protein
VLIYTQRALKTVFKAGVKIGILTETEIVITQTNMVQIVSSNTTLIISTTDITIIINTKIISKTSHSKSIKKLQLNTNKAKLST